MYKLSYMIGRAMIYCFEDDFSCCITGIACNGITFYISAHIPCIAYGVIFFNSLTVDSMQSPDSEL